MPAGFNSRSREGSDAIETDNLTRDETFQFTLPRGERHRDITLTEGIMRFNSRSREGSDVAGNQGLGTRGCFNSRSREGSDFENLNLYGQERCFNSRSREGSD